MGNNLILHEKIIPYHFNDFDGIHLRTLGAITIIIYSIKTTTLRKTFEKHWDHQDFSRIRNLSAAWSLHVLQQYAKDAITMFVYPAFTVLQRHAFLRTSQGILLCVIVERRPFPSAIYTQDRTDLFSFPRGSRITTYCSLQCDIRTHVQWKIFSRPERPKDYPSDDDDAYPSIHMYVLKRDVCAPNRDTATCVL